MMEKLLHFDGQDRNTGSVFTQIVRPGRSGLEKMAQGGTLHPDVQRYIRDMDAKPGHTYLLNNALGSWEVYGSNINGDTFPEDGLLHGHTGLQQFGLDDVAGRTAYASKISHGYPTFYTAHIFQHHANKDPKKTLGVICLVVWNPRMHRVEVIFDLDHELCRAQGATGLLERVNAGDFPATSMGCFTDPDAPIWTPEGFRRIADIQKGDQVWSGEGRVQTVEYKMERFYEGHAFTLSANGISDLEMTEEHPCRIIHRSDIWSVKDEKSRISRDWLPSEEKAAYIRVDEAAEGDYLVQPIPQGEEHQGLSDDLLILAGHYLAEGYGNINNGGKQIYPWFIVNKKDRSATEIPELMARINPVATVSVWEHPGSEEALNIQVFDSAIGQLLVDLCGRTSNDKHLSPELLRLPFRQQLLFLGAYLDGDGFTYGRSLYASTKSEGLAYQLQILAARLGMLGNINVITHQPNKLVKKVTTEYQLHISHTGGAHKMAGYCRKAVDLVPAERPSNSPKILTDWAILTPITAISRRFFQGTVYNFSVGEDDSYVAGGVAVHNCKVPDDRCNICGNRAKTRHDYCVHVSNNHPDFRMNKILRDGRKCCVHNDKPRFFDDSFVTIGADKTAFVMAKVAAAGQKYWLFTKEGLALPSALRGELYYREESFEKTAAIRQPHEDDGDYAERRMHESGDIVSRRHASPEQLKKHFPQKDTRPLLWKMLSKNKETRIKAAGLPTKTAAIHPDDYHHVAATLPVLPWELDSREKALKNTELGIANWEKPKQTGMFPLFNKEEYRAKEMAAWERTRDPAYRKELAIELVGDMELDKEASIDDEMFELQVKKAGRKLGEMLKQLPPGPSSVLKRLEQLEKPLPTDALDVLASAPDISTALAAPTRAAIVLRPEEYQRVCLTHAGHGPMARGLWDRGVTFDPLMGRATGMSPGAGANPLAEILHLIRPLLGSARHRSCCAPVFQRRITMMFIEQPPEPLLRDTSSGVMQKLADGYADYRESVMGSLHEIVEGLSHREIKEAALRDEILDLRAGMKTASPLLAIPLAALAILGPLTYLNAAHWKSQEEMGEDLGLLKGLIADHPALVTALTTGVGTAATLRPAQVEAALRALA